MLTMVTVAISSTSVNPRSERLRFVKEALIEEKVMDDLTEGLPRYWQGWWEMAACPLSRRMEPGPKAMEPSPVPTASKLRFINTRIR